MGFKTSLVNPDTLKTVHINLQNTTGGLIVGGETQRPMRYSTLDRLIFVTSFIWMIHWGVKVSEVAINALF